MKNFEPRWYILRNRVPVPVHWRKAAEWRAKNEDKIIVAQWDFPLGYVSTVFLSLDHNHWNDGPPLLFETLVFGGPEDGYMLRYSTWGEAEHGHMQTCERIRNLSQHVPEAQ